ncbi:MAG: NAD(P)-dependent oxidoreductase [Verrucomicrobia bacterium]|nr:NAD(P)-dependent oxidoreductase [Verrucomicrobiota bacterium]
MGLKLITGAPGWLGTRLTRILVEGHPDLPDLVDKEAISEIRCLTLSGADTSVLTGMSGKVKAVEGDIRDDAAVKAFCAGAEGSTIFHCAGVIHPTQGVKQFYEVNTEGTKRLLRCAEETGVKRVVVVSSNSPIGTNPSRDHRFDETSPYNPYMNYGRSKVLMEKAVADCQARGKLETVIIRPPWFYGPDQPPRQTLFFTMIKEGKGPVVGDGGNMRSMAYVDNICQGLVLCEKASVANGQTYWIADEEPYSMNTVIDTIERLLETEFGMTVAHKRMRLPHVAGQVAQLVDWALQRAGLYQQKIHVLSEMNKTIACSVEKAKRDLGYKPTVALEEGMRRSIRWCLDNGQSI